MATPPPIDKELQLQQILDLWATGYSSHKIGRELGVSHETVQQRLREATEAMRARNAAHVDEACMQQDLAICWLYEHCITAIKSAPAFHERAVKCAIALMERRARLLGMDADKTKNTAGAFGWLDGASGADIAKLARTYGIPIPEPFAAAVA